MKPVLLSATLLSLAPSLFSVGQEDASLREPQSRLSEHIIWSSSHPDRIEFIPVSQLQAAARSSLPAHPDEIHIIEAVIRISRAKRSQGEDVYCDSSAHGGASGKPSGEVRPLVDLLHFLPFTGYGTVIEVVPGLSRSYVVTMVYVEVEEIWGCRQPGGAWHEETYEDSYDCPEPAGTRTIAVGDVVAVLQQKGQIEVDGEILCEATDEILETPDIGTKVVFGGGTYAVIDPHYIGRGLLLPVVDGQILPQPYESLSERIAQPFEEVRAQMEAGFQVCEGADETD